MTAWWNGTIPGKSTVKKTTEKPEASLLKTTVEKAVSLCWETVLSELGTLSLRCLEQMAFPLDKQVVFPDIDKLLNQALQRVSDIENQLKKSVSSKKDKKNIAQWIEQANNHWERSLLNIRILMTKWSYALTQARNNAHKEKVNALYCSVNGTALAQMTENHSERVAWTKHQASFSFYYSIMDQLDKESKNLLYKISVALIPRQGKISDENGGFLKEYPSLERLNEDLITLRVRLNACSTEEEATAIESKLIKTSYEGTQYYRQFSRELHPDKNPESTQAMSSLNGWNRLFTAHINDLKKELKSIYDELEKLREMKKQIAREKEFYKQLEEKLKQTTSELKQTTVNLEKETVALKQLEEKQRQADATLMETDAKLMQTDAKLIETNAKLEEILQLLKPPSQNKQNEESNESKSKLQFFK